MRIFPVRYPARVDGDIVDRQLKQDARISPEIDNQLCRSAGHAMQGAAAEARTLQWWNLYSPSEVDWGVRYARMART